MENTDWAKGTARALYEINQGIKSPRVGVNTSPEYREGYRKVWSDHRKGGAK